MRFVSPILKRVVYPSLASVGQFHSANRTGLAVVTYHGVFPPGYKPIDPGFDGSLITADTFRRQLRLLKKKYNVISPDEMLRWCRREGELPARAALLTCDDGFMSNLTEMLPILQDEGLKCLFFVTGASLGEHRNMLWYEEFLLLMLRARAGSFRISQGNFEIGGVLGEREQRRAVWWGTVRHLSRLDAENRDAFLREAHLYFGMPRTLEFYLATYPEARRHFCLMTSMELKQLADAGMTIGAHTLTHPVLSEAPPELARYEIVESRKRLEAILNRKIWALAYPFGDASSVTPGTVLMAQQAGFDAAFLNVGGGLGTHLPLHAIPRVHVNSDMSLAEFEAHVSGFHESIQRWRRPPGEQAMPMVEAVHT
jgi:peptidoglycan/xylan/chitin deacetylase (PgdA/CDA1 family)